MFRSHRAPAAGRRGRQETLVREVSSVREASSSRKQAHSEPVPHRTDGVVLFGSARIDKRATVGGHHARPHQGQRKSNRPIRTRSLPAFRLAVGVFGSFKSLQPPASVCSSERHRTIVDRTGLEVIFTPQMGYETSFCRSGPGTAPISGNSRDSNDRDSIGFVQNSTPLGVGKARSLRPEFPKPSGKWQIFNRRRRATSLAGERRALLHFPGQQQNDGPCPSPPGPVSRFDQRCRFSTPRFRLFPPAASSMT